MMTDSPDDAPVRARDIYGRKAVSQSRGRTHERIMALQHAEGSLPGADELLAEAPAGSIGAGIRGFHAQWVTPLKSVTSRRAYERSLVLLAKDLAERDVSGQLTDPVGSLRRESLTEHLTWRIVHGMIDAAELQRCAAHLTRLAAWLDEHAGGEVGLERGDLRAVVAALPAGDRDRGQLAEQAPQREAGERAERPANRAIRISAEEAADRAVAEPPDD